MARFILLIVVLGSTPSQTEAPKLFREKAFTCASLAEATNHYVALGEEAAIKELESLVLDWSKDRKGDFSRNERIGWVCRILFQSKGKEALNGPGFGSLLNLPEMPLKKWPLYPVASSGATYFVLSEGYSLDGFPENPRDYLKYCRTNGKFLTERIIAPTRVQALKDLEKLEQTEAWKELKWTYGENSARSFLKAQAENIPAK